MKHFGPDLRKARTRKGLTQADIAKHLNYDHSYISKVENSKAPSPDLDTLLKWAFYVGAKEVIVNYVISYPVPTTTVPKKAA
jgi:transcriptional regulator with XRE-family HTH domain